MLINKYIVKLKLNYFHITRIQDQALDLIDKMMRINPNERFDAEEALNHPFFS
jgi:serine/threonine protein kinase